MTTEVASAILDCTPGQVAKLCSEGKLAGSTKVRRPGTKFGKVWNVNGQAVRTRKAALARKARGR